MSKELNIKWPPEKTCIYVCKDSKDLEKDGYVEISLVPNRESKKGIDRTE